MTLGSIPPERDDLAEASFRTVFARALEGLPCAVVPVDDEPTHLPVGDWVAEASRSDRALLEHCEGPTIDIGCGPGRMTALLGELGHLVLGIDVVPEAVHLARGRGAPALTRDVFDPLPGEGDWGSALLADTNIGIGGDPVALLRRVRDLLAPGGRLVVELGERGEGLHSWWATLECDGARSRPFRWATVGAETIPRLAAEAGLEVATDAHTHGSRWCAVLVRPTP